MSVIKTYTEILDSKRKKLDLCDTWICLSQIEFQFSRQRKATKTIKSKVRQKRVNANVKHWLVVAEIQSNPEQKPWRRRDCTLSINNRQYQSTGVTRPYWRLWSLDFKVAGGKKEAEVELLLTFSRVTIEDCWKQFSDSSSPANHSTLSVESEECGVQV